MKWCWYKNTVFSNIWRIKITQQSITSTSLEKYSLNRNTCMPFRLYVSSECLSPPYIRVQTLRVSLQFNVSDSESYHRTVCSIKCKDSLSTFYVLLGTSLSSAAVFPLSVWTVRSQTSLRWTFRRPSWSPACRSEGRSDRCFHSA